MRILRVTARTANGNGFAEQHVADSAVGNEFTLDEARCGWDSTGPHCHDGAG